VLAEQGLYFFIARSDKPLARPFQKWVAGDVLPAIRKDGAYVLGEEKVETGEITDDELIRRALAALNRKSVRLEEENAALRLTVDQLMPTALSSVTVNENKARKSNRKKVGSIGLI